MSNKDDIFDDDKTDKGNKAVKVESEFKPGIGVDIGTSFLCTTRQKKTGEFVSKFHRNMVFPMDVSEEAENLLSKGDYLYVRVDDKYYICGNDALSISNVTGGEVMRCMKDGFINPSIKESSDLLFYIISSIVGKPIIDNENLVFSVPGQPIDGSMNNLFHKMVLNGFFSKMGYDAKDVNEAMAICYNDNPIMNDSDNKKVPLSGISISFGAGMQNLALSFKGMGLIEFSCMKSGDYIDEMTSNVTGVLKGKVIRIKEKDLNLDKIDMENRVQVALGIYYDDLINRVVHNISNKFKEKSSEFDGEIEIVIGGGTAMVPGFCKKFEEAIKKSSMPFKIYRIRPSSSMFFAVTQGCCLKAQSNYQKTVKK